MIHTFFTIGTAASLRIPDTDQRAVPLDAVRCIFDAADARFSLYRPDSEASRLARGELGFQGASKPMLDAYVEALEWRGSTVGAFTPHRPDGIVDLSGIVKALAIAGAGQALRSAGFENWLLNVGGDVLSAGTDNNLSWRAGVVDPQDRAKLLCAVSLGKHRHAIATSGTTERGEHIWRYSPGSDPLDLVQVTVLSSGMIQADVLATAILAGGLSMLDFATERWDIDVLASTRNGALRVTPGFRSMILQPEHSPGQ